MATQSMLTELEQGLDDFDQNIRQESLASLLEYAHKGEIELPHEKEIANLHCHSFFSFNGYGYSPTHLAWIGKKIGLQFMGIVDFDVLDGVDEFLDACEKIGLRGSAGIETRVYVPQFAEREINSPGEPGIFYDMGIGFTSKNEPEESKSILADMRSRAARRNCEILEKVNAFLQPLLVDYERDVLPLTPSGNATERHMVAVIVAKSFKQFEDPAQFWSDKLKIPAPEISAVLNEREAFQDLVRKKLMKRGGVGYVQPASDSFPVVDEFHTLIKSCRAIPCAAWLDGTSAGEQDMEELLALLIEKGAAAINIVPERNWNISDPQEKKTKLAHLYNIVALAKKLNLPIMVGTEMNSFGQKLVDDFEAPELQPLKASFLEGAWFIYGHTWMQKRWGMGFLSDWAAEYLPERKNRNEFYISAGRLLPATITKPELSAAVNQQQNPDQVLVNLRRVQATQSGM